MCGDGGGDDDSEGWCVAPLSDTIREGSLTANWSAWLQLMLLCSKVEKRKKGGTATPPMAKVSQRMRAPVFSLLPPSASGGGDGNSAVAGVRAQMMAAAGDSSSSSNGSRGNYRVNDNWGCCWCCCWIFSRCLGLCLWRCCHCHRSHRCWIEQNFSRWCLRWSCQPWVHQSGARLRVVGHWAGHNGVRRSSRRGCVIILLMFKLSGVEHTARHQTARLGHRLDGADVLVGDAAKEAAHQRRNPVDLVKKFLQKKMFC